MPVVGDFRACFSTVVKLTEGWSCSMVYTGHPQLPLACVETGTIGDFWSKDWLCHCSFFSPPPVSFIFIRPFTCLCLAGCRAITQTCQACFSPGAFALTVPFACSTSVPDVLECPSSYHAGFCTNMTPSEGLSVITLSNYQPHTAHRVLSHLVLPYFSQ